MNYFFNLPCCCVGFIIHYFLVFLVKFMAVFPAMISSLVSSGISISYSSGVFFSPCAIVRLILQIIQPHSLCSHIYRQCCFFATEGTRSFACDRSVRSVVVVQNVQLMLWSLKILLSCSLVPFTYGRLIFIS